MALTWSVPLRGHAFDLERLGASFRDDPRVEVDASGEYLTRSSTFETLDNAVAVIAEAKRLILRLNGLAHISNADHRNVWCVDRAVRSVGEQQHHFVFINDEAGGRDSVASVVVKVGAAQDVLVPPPPIPPDTLAVIDANVDLAEAVDWFGREPVTWFDLYKVLELAKKAVGRDAIIVKGWATKRELERLTATADRPELSGKEARHAVTKGDPASQRRYYMSLDDGIAVCQRIVRCWIDATRSDEAE